MLAMWSEPDHDGHSEQRMEGAKELVEVLDWVSACAAVTGVPLAVQIYAGNRCPEGAHWVRGLGLVEDGHGGAEEMLLPVAAEPGDGPQPVLLLTAGAENTAMYWIGADGREHTSAGSGGNEQAEFLYLYGGQESYAPAGALVSSSLARQAASQFMANNGERPTCVSWHN